ncbi:MAG: ThuA protein [Microbacteriaceae bacterium]|jgi:type 1 glutamine amidotransferase|nr:ThuA protein [Microbacteriaceae bacterium]
MLPDTLNATVLIAGDDVYEDLLGASMELVEIASGAGMATRARVGLGSFAELARSGETPDLLLLYTAMGECTSAQQQALSDAVAGGMGILAIHTAVVFPTDGDSVAPTHHTLFELLGSRYSSHGPQPHESRFTVMLDRQHPITAGLADFEVGHEHYRLELAMSEPTVLAWRETAEGREPLLYVSERGAGRVCYLQLGHDMRVWQEPTVRALITRAIEWTRRGGTER